LTAQESDNRAPPGREHIPTPAEPFPYPLSPWERARARASFPLSPWERVGVRAISSFPLSPWERARARAISSFPLSPWERAGVRALPGTRTTGPDRVSGPPGPRVHREPPRAASGTRLPRGPGVAVIQLTV